MSRQHGLGRSSRIAETPSRSCALCSGSRTHTAQLIRKVECVFKVVLCFFHFLLNFVLADIDVAVQFPDLGIFPVYECFAAVLRRGAHGANRKFKLPHYQAETPMRIRTARSRRRSAMARALARLYGILRDASARACHRRHMATDRRAGTRDSVPVRRARGPAAGILPFAAARGNLSLGAHMLSGGSVRRSRRARSCRLWRMASAARRRPDLANRAV